MYRLYMADIIDNHIYYNDNNLEHVVDYHNEDLNSICEEIRNYFDKNIYVLKYNTDTFILDLNPKRFYNKLRVFKVENKTYKRRYYK